MNTVKDRNYYSKKQFDELFRNLNSNHNFPGLAFEGLWAFSYAKAANSLKHCYFESNSRETLDADVSRQIDSTFLDCDHGTLGAAFKKMKDIGAHFVSGALNTFDDVSGVVCYTDAAIRQEHAFFILIKEEDETLGVLDLFFSGDLGGLGSSAITNELSRLFSIGQPLAMASVIAFKMREHEDFLDIQRDDQVMAVNKPGASTDEIVLERITAAVRKLTKITAVSSYTPLFYIKDIDGSVIPELVGLNFDYIHSLIRHEYSFCPLTAEKECFYYKTFQSFNDEGLFCDNVFLKKYYHNVMKSLNGCVIKEAFELNGASYEAEFVYLAKEAADYGGALASVIADLQAGEREICGALDKFLDKYDYRPNEIARQKFQDELIYKELTRSINNSPLLMGNVVAIIIYKEVVPHLSYIGECFDRNERKEDVKDFVSLANVLKLRHRGVGEKDSRWFSLEATGKRNVVNFEITNPLLYEAELRRLIAADPAGYSGVLAPYLKRLKGLKSGNSKVNDLDIFYTGGDPFGSNDDDNDYVVALKAQMYLLVSLLKAKETVRYARKAAISQVLARNMSHNHGSHVLSRMIHPDQIKSLDHMHESLRNVLNRKILP
jgi:hypothetical protein